MSKYVEVSVNISEGQVRKIKDALEKGEGVTIRLSVEDLTGSHVLHLTKTQVNKIEKCKAEGKGLDLKMSRTQVKANVKLGGFLSAILPFLATAGKTLLSTVIPGILGGLSMAGGAKIVDAIDKKVQGQGLEYVRNGAEIKKVVYFKKGNNAYKVAKVGGGVFMTQWKKGSGVKGDGVYMKGPTGYGLITGTSPDESPVARIPILGQIPLISDLLKMIV